MTTTTTTTTTQLTNNKNEYVTQTYNFKQLINHVDIAQAEAEFVKKYGHLLDSNNLITRTLVDYETKTITIEGISTSLFHPVKEHNRGFIFDLPKDTSVYNEFIQVLKPLGIGPEDFTLYSKDNKLVTTSNKLTKEIIENAKEVIRLENRTDYFNKSYKFDKRPSVDDLLQSQLNFITSYKLHEDDIIFTSIYTTDEENTINISGKQSNKYKTYPEDVAAVINSCVVINRFDSCLESALKDGSDNVIQRVISYQHPIVNDSSLELLEGLVNITKTLEDITSKDGHIEQDEQVIETVNGNFPTNFSIADFATKTLREPEPQYPTVETGDKVYDGKVQTSFELQEITFGQPDKVNHETIHLSDLAKFKDSLYIKLKDNNIINDKVIEVLELTENDYYYTKDKTAINVIANHVTTDFIKDKIKQLGGHSKLAPEKEIRVFTFNKNLDLDVTDSTKDLDANNLTTVKAFFDELIQKYSDTQDVKIKPIKFEVDVNTNSASATVEITPNYLRQSTNLEAAVITILYNALLLKQVIDNKL